MLSRASRLVELWESTQVELHGRYSTDRTLALANYANENSRLRAIMVLVATPLPCLVIITLGDVLPLAAPSKIISDNVNFFVREYYAYLVMCFLCAEQFRSSVPTLPYPLKHVIPNTIVVAGCCVGFLYLLSLEIGFPVPFSIISVMPMWVVIMSITMAIEWRKKIRETAGSGTMVVNVMKVWMCEVLLVLIYPPYFYIFTTLTNWNQTGFALLLPMIKILMRNIFVRTVVHLRDDLPEVVIFNVEVFNALFVSYCMQNSPSIWTTLELMLAHVLLLGLSVRDVEIARRGLEDLEHRIEHEKKWIKILSSEASKGRRNSTLERVNLLLREETRTQATVSGPAIGNLTRVRPERKRTKSLVVMAVDACSTFALAPQPLRVAKQVFGRGSVNPVVEEIHLTTNKIPVTLRYTRKVRRLLYMAEFILLLHYVEVIIPLLFSMYLSVMYRLPNRDYYAQLVGMDENQLFQTLQNVLFYCSLQFVSLILLIIALQRKLGLSPIRQLGFVLEKQLAGVQTKLIFWVFYNVQASLLHSGYDYTFQFTWLREHSKTNSK